MTAEPTIRSILAAAFDTHRAEIEDAMAQSALAHNNNTIRYEERDIRQMVHGALAVWDETLHEAGNETRKVYMQSVLPSVVVRGTALAIIIGASVAIWSTGMAELVRRMPAEHQEAAIPVLATILRDWHQELTYSVTRTALEGRD